MESNNKIDLFESLKKEAIELLGPFTNKDELLSYVKILIENIEKENLKGQEKLELVIRILRDIVQTSELDEEERIFALALIDNGVIENTINMLIKAASGELLVNINLETVSSSCTSLKNLCKK